MSALVRSQLIKGLRFSTSSVPRAWFACKRRRATGVAPALAVVHSILPAVDPPHPVGCWSISCCMSSSSSGGDVVNGLPAGMISQLGQMKRRQQELVDRMTKGNVPAHDMGTLSKELGRLQVVLEAYAAVTARRAEAKDLEEVMRLSTSAGADADREMYEIAQEEHGECLRVLAAVQLELESLLLPRDETDSKNALLEVRSGSGGDEAAEFARDLFDMYRRFAERKGWSFEELHSSETDLGGYKEAAAAIRGDDVYGSLKHENGVHRVQRVPLNSTRLHTSAASVVVMMEAEDVDVTLNPSELRFDVYRASGAGGQHVNTTESAVRVTHIPTGLSAAIQDERSQHMNRMKALKVLRSRVFQARHEERAREDAVVRSSAVGTGDRSERIRTYNFPQDRVTDHRVNVTCHGWEQMMRGELLDTFQDALKQKSKEAHAKAVGSDARPP